MAGRNGRAPIVALPPGRRRFNAVPKTITFEVEVPGDGEPEIIEVMGYHKDAPEVWVEVQVQQAWREWRDASYDADGVFHQNDEAEARFRRDMLLAVTRGLQEHHADVLARDGGDWKPILAMLGYWKTDVADEEDDADPEAVGEEVTEPTGATSSPDLAPSTAPTTGSA